MVKNTAIIIRDKELIEKFDKLKKIFGYKTRTKTINELVKQALTNIQQYEDYKKSLKNPYWVWLTDLFLSNQEELEN